MEERESYVAIWQELSEDKEMVFVAGPRQAGKTTLAKIIADTHVNSLYFNWDIPEQRALLLENPRFFTEVKRRDSSLPLVVLDEIHKYRDWKNYLKGLYDELRSQYRLLVLGSGRLDLYQRGGDSLAGRYLLFRLWPFTLAELGGRRVSMKEFLEDPLAVNMEGRRELHEIWNGLSTLSGFPEPFLSGSERSYRRWSGTYSARLVFEDMRDLTGIRGMHDLETMFHLLPSKVGSPLSIPSLSRDLKVAYNTVASWLALFERFFLTFSISPWTSRISRAIQKERKTYLWDSPRIKDPAARFENQVALELWRAVTSWNDLGEGQFSLHFVKNRDQQEVDFLIASDEDPLVLIEAKLSERRPSPALRKFQNRLSVPAVQLTADGDSFKLLPNGDSTILVAPAHQWLCRLP